MNIKLVLGLTTAAVASSMNLYADELAWFPVPTDQPSSTAHVEAAFQVGSEVWIMYIVGDLVAPTAAGTTTPLEVDFPTLFVTHAFDQWDLDTYRDYLGFTIYGEVEGVPKKDQYDYTNGNGYIQHPVFGQLYVATYPWVYSPFFGWRYVREAGTAWGSNAWWFWETDTGWYWTSRNVFPLIMTSEGIKSYDSYPGI